MCGPPGRLPEASGRLFLKGTSFKSVMLALACSPTAMWTTVAYILARGWGPKSGVSDKSPEMLLLLGLDHRLMLTALDLCSSRDGPWGKQPLHHLRNCLEPNSRCAFDLAVE